jgi:NDP-sugar pyrophosphorylase family protein
MKCLIYASPGQTSWVTDFFLGINPFFIKILNKPLLEYYIDFCVLLGVTQVRVINNVSGSDLEKYFGDGTQWGINLSYGFAKPDDRLEDVLLKNRRFCQGNLFIVSGYQFIRYNKNYQYNSCFQGGDGLCLREGENSLYFLSEVDDIRMVDLVGIEEKECSKLGILAIDSISSYYALNMSIIEKYRNNYVLPGYNNEDGAYLGKNIIDKKSTEYIKPIVLGDSVQIQMNTVIGPNVILGDNVIIDHSTQLRNCIVYDNSYIGSDLEIEKKIVFKKRLIEPVSGEMMQIVDSFLVSDIRSNMIENSLMKVINGVITVILIALTTLPYMIFFSLCKIFGMRTDRENYFVDQEGKSKEFPTFHLSGYNIFKKIFFRFSLDFYPFYFRVLNSDLLLTGNHLLKREAGGVKQLHQLPVYYPGVYNYPGSMLHNQNHENYINDELEYIHLRGFLFDLKLIINTWISRLFSDWNSIAEFLGEQIKSNDKAGEDG